jgi:predicted DNA-binding ArsR family transcriptional regulator
MNEDKKATIAELSEKADVIMDRLLSDPEFKKAMEDRRAHIERGELWITPAAIKYSLMIAQVNQIRAMIGVISAASDT